MTGRPRAALLVTGVGLGGFLDGIVLHQILQWHHLVTAYRPASDVRGLEHNTFWDGVFHLACWLVVAGGIAWLLREGPRVRGLGPRRCAGLLLAGWGLFNVADQLLFHLLLGAHHIREVERYQLYDWGFFALGLLLVAAGLALSRERPPAASPASG